MPRTDCPSTVTRPLSAALLIVLLAIGAGLAGLHSHGADAVRDIDGPSCQACALGHAPAALPIANETVLPDLPAIESVGDAAEALPAGFVDRSLRGRAPPAC